MVNYSWYNSIDNDVKLHSIDSVRKIRKLWSNHLQLNWKTWSIASILRYGHLGCYKRCSRVIYCWCLCSGFKVCIYFIYHLRNNYPIRSTISPRIMFKRKFENFSARVIILSPSNMSSFQCPFCCSTSENQDGLQYYGRCHVTRLIWLLINICQ